jgi:hypothetical protein
MPGFSKELGFLCLAGPSVTSFSWQAADDITLSAAGF